AGWPRLAFNSLASDSERSEHLGLMNLIKGLFGAFRNTTAHIPKIHWNVTEHDALDILTPTINRARYHALYALSGRILRCSLASRTTPSSLAISVAKSPRPKRDSR